MKTRYLLLTTITLSLSAFAEVERPVYSARFTKDEVVLQSPSCKNRVTTEKDFDCSAYYSSEVEAGTGNTLKTVSVSCTSSSDDEKSWCKAGDTQIAFGKEIKIPFNKVKVYGIADPGIEHPLLSTLIKGSLEDKDDRGIQLKFESDTLPTLTKDTVIDEP